MVVRGLLVWLVFAAFAGLVLLDGEPSLFAIVYLALPGVFMLAWYLHLERKARASMSVPLADPASGVWARRLPAPCAGKLRGVEWWLLLLVVPLALLVLAGNMLMATISLREGRRMARESWRSMSGRQRALYVFCLLLAAAWGGTAIWVLESPEIWRAAGWVLLGLMGFAVLCSLLVLPVLVWREYRAHRAERRRRQSAP